MSSETPSSSVDSATSPAKEEISFNDLDLLPQVIKALNDIGYEKPSPIQAATIPHLLDGHDVLGMAQTGTGKTAAFALPVLSKIDVKKKHTQSLVLCPTRELAIQVAEAFQSYAAHLKGFQVLPIYGGQDMRTQLRSLQRGAQVVVATPGRLLDHINRRSINLSSLDVLVLDEADEMLRMGFIDDVESILKNTPQDRQVALFSATMPGPIRRVAEKYLNKPKEVRIETAVTTNENIEQQYWLVSGASKLEALTRMLEVEEFDGMIIFVRTKTSTVDLADRLNARGFSASPLNGDMNQALRQRTVEHLKGGKLDILVATDVAARGLDVERISHVVNFDIPYDEEAYVHRIGRTGRAGRTGKAILFVTSRERRLLRSIEKTTRQTIKPITLPSREQLIDKRAAQFKASVAEALPLGNTELFHSMVSQLCEEEQVNVEEIAAALVYLAQKDRPLVPPKERAPRENRNERDDRSRNDRSRDKRDHKDRKDKRDKKGKRSDVPMDVFKIAVGHNHEVKPGEIVGAIANEAGIEGKHIGQIRIKENHSYVELPSGMPNDTFSALKNTRVRQQILNIEKAENVDMSKPKRQKRRS